MTEAEIKIENKIPPKKQRKQKKHKKKNYIALVIVIFLLISTVCCVFAAYQVYNSISATVMINSLYSTDGKNPDGTPFSIMEMFNDDIMNSASEKLDKKISAEEIRSHLTISDTMTSVSFSQLEQSIFDGEEEDTYFPTEYMITYSVVSEQIKSEGILAQFKNLWFSFSLPTKYEILCAVLSSYEEYYAEKYLSYDSVFDIDWEAADSMDYYNRYEFMNNIVNRLVRFLEYKDSCEMKQAKSETHTDYYDLITELSNGPQNGISNYQAYVTQNGVTNDREELLRQFVYMQRLNEEENTRKMQEYNVLREAIEMYDSTTTKVVFIPALDDNNSFYMNRTKVGLDYLTEKADAAKLQADTAAHIAKNYSYLQTCFADEYITEEAEIEIENEAGTETEAGHQQKNTPEQRLHADALYESLKKEIQRLTDEAFVLSTEEKPVNQKDINISEPFSNVSIVSICMSAAKRFVLLSMATYVVVYVPMLMSERKRKEYKEAE